MIKRVSSYEDGWTVVECRDTPDLGPGAELIEKQWGQRTIKAYLYEFDTEEEAFIALDKAGYFKELSAKMLARYGRRHFRETYGT